jgi:hydroxypyruvate reductase
VVAAVRREPAAFPRSDGPVFVAADNATARSAAAALARDRGLSVVEIEEPFAGEARAVGRTLYERARSGGADSVVAGGESTVTLCGGGRGGRNHEILLGVVDVFDGGLLVGVGTDGVDGSSGAAGALLDAEVVNRARGLDAHAILEDNDSARYFRAADAQLVTGPTGTNVADLWIYLGD